MADYLEIIELLKQNGVHFAPGLTEEELARAESTYGFVFPASLREFYAIALPVATDEPVTPRIRDDWFPLWNDFSDDNVETIRARMAYPLRSILWDVENNGDWRKAWGERPTDLAEALEKCRTALAADPVMIPVHAHRYMPALADSDPYVLSIHGFDTILYGDNLEDYLRNEFIRDEFVPHEFHGK